MAVYIRADNQMKIDGKDYRTIWVSADGWSVEVIDQTWLPHDLVTLRLETVDEVCEAIKKMVVRGAPLIGVTAAYGICLAMYRDPSSKNLNYAYQRLIETRPTAINLKWALDEMVNFLGKIPDRNRRKFAYEKAAQIAENDVEACEKIGSHGKTLLVEMWERNGSKRPLNVLTHCNAGWLATVDWGTALAPIYKAHDSGIPLHIWVDETRPRNQGAFLTAFELLGHEVPHTVIVDNAGGHLMQKGLVDICITGSDRTTAAGDVCNKIGTYLKALAAFDNNVPFYVALPHNTIDWSIQNGEGVVPIEQRDPHEVTTIAGLDDSGKIGRLKLTPKESMAANYAFDVTPSRLISGLITERGICDASADGLRSLYREEVD